ncbi:MAG TPA: tetratricopeptide repeat protein [Longimicrobiales bacterium]|nr:tetratricopeptide repeat protein [Longimicrobiales bacterium]
MSSLLDRLKRRKLIHWSMAYLAAAWVVVQVASEIAEPWGWSPAVLQALQILLAVGFLATLVVAWHHGEKGRQRPPLSEIVLLSALGITAVIAVLSVRPDGSTRDRGSGEPPGAPLLTLERTQPTIAVMPLKNISPDPSNAYFAEGMHEEIMTRLARISSLVVIARTSVMRFADGQTGISEIGAQLGAAFVLEGSARVSGDQVRVTVQLIDVETRGPVWAELYARALTVGDLFDIQIDLAERITDALEVELTPRDRTRVQQRPTRSLEAYQSYLLGLAAWRRRTAESLEETIRHYEVAIAVDSSFALPHAGLAEALAAQPWYQNRLDSEAALREGQAHAERALELDPSLGGAYASLGLMKEMLYDWVGAEEDFRRAIEISPEHATAHHWYANMLSRLGRFEEGQAEIRRAYELDPLSGIINQDVGYNLALAGDLAGAARQYRRALDLNPEFPTTTMVLANTVLDLHEFDEARDAFTRWAEMTGNDPDLLGALADRSRAFAETGDPQPPPPGLDLEAVLPPFAVAPTYIHLGLHEEAVRAVERAFAEGQVAVTLGLGTPTFDPIRSDPRFQAVARWVGVGSVDPG